MIAVDFVSHTLDPLFKIYTYVKSFVINTFYNQEQIVVVLAGILF